MSNWQAEQAERNRKSLARLTKALPASFPSAVLARALSRPFIPPTPRLAIDSYWRAHPIRADRLARAPPSSYNSQGYHYCFNGAHVWDDLVWDDLGAFS
jgi:hypothetical protein